ncbi:hypothetical protein DPMN_098272 [Dreissena polymorpha]|uniref:Uncharacterized protein n=1 Tax=Dreissena polymorpha TaxID=45954 RepID=A0A9D4LED6_DREPO|nr:hypothetical protein DPMN_098272 [Dreissena polymorpha]
MGDVKRSVESTYSRVSRVIEQLCAPPTKPEPSLQCSAVMPEERTEERTESKLWNKSLFSVH